MGLVPVACLRRRQTGSPRSQDRSLSPGCAEECRKKRREGPRGANEVRYHTKAPTGDSTAAAATAAAEKLMHVELSAERHHGPSFYTLRISLQLSVIVSLACVASFRIGTAARCIKLRPLREGLVQSER